MEPRGKLLAVDLGLRIGYAVFAGDGSLVRYGSRHLGSRTQLRAAARRLFDEAGDPVVLALEGGGETAVAWHAEARRRGTRVVQIDAGRWRNDILLPREHRPGRDPKRPAVALARALIEAAGVRRPTSLRHDAAEAILLGAWALAEVGWTDGLPVALRR